MSGNRSRCKQRNEYLVLCNCCTKTLQLESERMAIVDSELVAHDLERQACVLANTRRITSAHSWRQSLLFPDAHCARPRGIESDPCCVSTIEGCFADPTPALDDDGVSKTLCQILLTIHWSLTQTLGFGSSTL